MYHYLENTQSRNAYWFVAWHPNGGRYWIGRGKLGATPVANVYTCRPGLEEFNASKKSRGKLAGDYRRVTPTSAMESRIREVIGAPPSPTPVAVVPALVSVGNVTIGHVDDIQVVADRQPPPRVVTVPKEPSRWDV